MSVSTQKAALTRQEKALREVIDITAADRGLWEGLSPEDLQRNQNFIAGLRRRLDEVLMNAASWMPADDQARGVLGDRG